VDFEVIMRCVDDEEEFQLAKFEADTPQAAVDTAAKCFEVLASELKGAKVEEFEDEDLSGLVQP
jgi:hypothetical protein